MNALKRKKCPFVLHSTPDRFETHKMCEKAFSEDFFMLKYCLDRYKTQEMCDKALNNFLPTLNFIPDWFATSKLFKKIYNALSAMMIYYFLMEILVMSRIFK